MAAVMTNASRMTSGAAAVQAVPTPMERDAVCSALDV